MEGYKKDKKKRKCGFCQYDHKTKQCSNIKEEDLNRRWESAEKQKLYFRCLERNNLPKSFKNSRVCGIDKN